MLLSLCLLRSNVPIPPFPLMNPSPLLLVLALPLEVEFEVEVEVVSFPLPPPPPTTPFALFLLLIGILFLTPIPPSPIFSSSYSNPTPMRNNPLRLTLGGVSKGWNSGPWSERRRGSSAEGDQMAMTGGGGTGSLSMVEVF